MLKVLSNTSVGTLFSLLANLLSLPFLSRAVSPNDFGTYFVLFTTTLIWANICCWGIPSIYLQAKPSEEMPLIVEANNKIFKILTIGALAVLAILAIKQINFNFLFPVILAALTLSYGQLAASQLIKNKHYLEYSAIIFLSSGATPIIQLILLKSYHLEFANNLQKLTAALGISNVLSLLLMIFLVRNQKMSIFTLKNISIFKEKRLPSELRDKINNANLSFIISLIRPKTILYSTQSNHLLGIYSQFERLTSAPTSLTQAVLRPLAGKYFGENQNVNKHTFDLILIELLFLTPLLAGLIVYSKNIGEFLLGPQVLEGAAFFNILLISGTLMMSLSWVDTIFIQLNKQKLLLRFETFSLLSVILAGVVCSITSTPSYQTITTLSLLGIFHYIALIGIVGWTLDRVLSEVTLKIAVLVGSFGACVSIGRFLMDQPIYLAPILLSIAIMLFIFGCYIFPQKTDNIFILTNSEESLLGHRSKYIEWLSQKEKNIFAVGPFHSTESKDFCTRNSVRLLSTTLSRDNINPFIEVLTSMRYFKHFLIYQPKVVHAFTLKAVIQALIIGRLTNTPKIICSITGLGFIFISNSRKAIIVRKAVTLLIKVFAKTNKVTFIFQNEDDLNLFVSLKLIKPTQCVLIPGSGVDTSRFNVIKSNEKTTKVVGLFAGRLLIDKGLQELFKAAINLKELAPNLEIWIAGDVDANNPNSLKKEDLLLAQESTSNLKFLGHLKDMKATIAQCDFAILPSYREGLSMFLLESMASGKAIITTDAPGCRQIIDTKIPNGILVQPKSASDIEEAIMRLYSNRDLLVQYGKNSRVLAETKYSSEIIFQQIYSTYLWKAPVTRPLH